MFGHPEEIIGGVRCYLYDCPVHGHVAFNADQVDRFKIISHPCCFKERLDKIFPPEGVEDEEQKKEP